MPIIKPAMLALKDGRVFEGRSCGADGERAGEIVFNTSLTGYQEIFSDPSYRGQIVAMTYPHIGNTGVNDQDFEARDFQAEGLVVREMADAPSNWRATKSLRETLREQGVVALEGVDTRALVRHVRTQGAMRAILSTEDLDPASLVRKARSSPSLSALDLVGRVSTTRAYEWREGYGAAWRDGEPTPPRFHVVAYDFGVKRNILRALIEAGCRVTVVPRFTPAEDALALAPDGVLLSNGPGDPEREAAGVAAAKVLMEKVPVFGICLGHQILGLALGGKTYKLKFGHRGGNHPVKDMRTGKVSITSQNHGFSVDADSLPASLVEATHINLNDHTLEGFRHRSLPVMAVQYHPEAAPGPHDARGLFTDFVEMMEGES